VTEQNIPSKDSRLSLNRESPNHKKTLAPSCLRGQTPAPRIQFNLRFSSAAELAALKARAAELDLPAAEYLRRAALDTVAFHDDLRRRLRLQARYDRASVKALQRVGVNLNQVVRHLHRQEFDDVVLTSFRRVLRKLDELLGKG